MRILLSCILLFSLAAAGAEAQKIMVLEFQTTDQIGQKFYRAEEPETAPAGNTALNAEDLRKISPVMLGVVRAIDALGNLNLQNRAQARREETDDRERDRLDELAEKLTETRLRPSLLGADYLAAALGRYPEQFQVLSIHDLKAVKLPPETTGLAAAGAIAAQTGATLFATGTIADFRTETRTFRGYGVEVRNVSCSLDVVVKVFSTAEGKVLMSGVFTGSRTFRQTANAAYENDQLYQELLKSALQQAAARIAGQLTEKGEK